MARTGHDPDERGDFEGSSLDLRHDQFRRAIDSDLLRQQGRRDVGPKRRLGGRDTDGETATNRDTDGVGVERTVGLGVDHDSAR